MYTLYSVLLLILKNVFNKTQLYNEFILQLCDFEY